MRAMFIAVGNALRRDDGVAHRVLDLLGPVANVVTHDVLQLMPEIAEEIAPAEVVVFIDAHTEPGRPRLEPVRGRSRSWSSLAHAMTPEELVALSGNLYGFRGECFLCHVPGVDFSEGESLTEEAEANAKAAAELLKEFVVQPALSSPHGG
jgi:hydrogenase maturation protease